MKKFLIGLLLLLPMVALAEENTKIPLKIGCATAEGHENEKEYCELWSNYIKTSGFFRPADATETHIQYVALVKYDPHTEMLAVSNALNFYSPGLAGFRPIIWQRVNIVREGQYKQDAKKGVSDFLKTLLPWLENAAIAINNLCPENRQYKSVCNAEE